MQVYEPLESYSIPIEQSVDIMTNHLEKVDSVTAWAELMGYSRSYFSTSFSECFGEPPLQCLRRVRHKKLQEFILEYSHETSRSIARRMGLRNEQALYKFLNRHYDTNFTELRKKLLNEGDREA